MDLKKAIEIIWDNRKYTTNDPKTAISHLNEEVAGSLKALLNGDIEKAKKELQDAMSCLFIAMKVLEVDPEEAVKNQVEQMTKKNNRIMFVKSEKVEIYVNGQLKGGWSVWSQEDIKEAEKLAAEFGCELVYEFKQD
ncbi:hypothetical protein [Alkaliphilus crotonatoxidans]